MIPLRIAFDMDGTLADLSSAYASLEERIFGPETTEHEQPAPEAREEEQHAEEGQPEGAAPAVAAGGEAPRKHQERRMSARSASRHRDRIWRVIEATPDFWLTLKPIDPEALKRLNHLTREHRWEVFFITQRPATAGGTVQWQTHKWLLEHGISMPNVIPLSGGRGRAASALQLDYLVDDTPQNCVDVLSDSSTRAILLIDPDDPIAETSARRLGIGTARSINEALDLLVQATSARTNPSLFEKLRKLVGWK
jgi:deoxypyrimidine-specific 5' nucleotidase type C protein (NT5C)